MVLDENSNNLTGAVISVSGINHDVTSGREEGGFCSLSQPSRTLEVRHRRKEGCRTWEYQAAHTGKFSHFWSEQALRAGSIDANGAAGHSPGKTGDNLTGVSGLDDAD